MINSLRGKVISTNEEGIILDVSGFGIEVLATRSLISHAAAGDELSCFAYMQVNDAGMYMFGFSSERERMLFLELVQVKTIGGKLAMNILRRLDAEQVLQAIVAGSPAMLTVPGLGAKRAERICFELKNKIAKKFADIGPASASGETSFDSSVMDALMGLGFSQSESARAISLAQGESEPDSAWTEETLLKQSLRILQKH